MKHLATRSDKILSEFGDVIIQTKKVIEEINQFYKPFKKLMINWLVSMPWAYFEGLFLYRKFIAHPVDILNVRFFWPNIKSYFVICAIFK